MPIRFSPRCLPTSKTITLGIALAVTPCFYHHGEHHPDDFEPYERPDSRELEMNVAASTTNNAGHISLSIEVPPNIRVLSIDRPA